MRRQADAIDGTSSARAVALAALAWYGPQAVVLLLWIAPAEPGVRWPYLTHFLTLPGLLFGAAIRPEWVGFVVEAAITIGAVGLLAAIMTAPLRIKWAYQALAAGLSAANAATIASWLRA